MPKAKVDLRRIKTACPVVQAWMEQGSFDIDELKSHVASCDVCRGIQSQVDDAVRRGLNSMDGSNG